TEGNNGITPPLVVSPTTHALRVAGGAVRGPWLTSGGAAVRQAAVLCRRLPHSLPGSPQEAATGVQSRSSSFGQYFIGSPPPHVLTGVLRRYSPCPHEENVRRRRGNAGSRRCGWRGRCTT